MIDFVTAIASVPAILALVNLLKKFGIDGKWSALAAVFIGITLNVMQWAWADYSWFTAASSGLIYGLAAAGLYDITPGGKAPDATIIKVVEPDDPPF